MTRQGHEVRLIAPKFVAPYRMSGKRGKNDAADAAVICEAVSRPAMRFVPVKNIEQQSELFLHRARPSYVEQRTALINRIRVCCRNRAWSCRRRPTPSGASW